MAGPLAGSRISGRHGWAAQTRGSTPQEFLALLAKKSSHRVDVGMQVAGWLVSLLGDLHVQKKVISRGGQTSI